MHTQRPLTVTLEPDPLDWWAEERTVSVLRALALWLHGLGFSLRETAAALKTVGVTWSHQAVFQWVHRVAEEAPDSPTSTRSKPLRGAVDETVVTIGTERHWLYTAIEVKAKLLLDVRLSPRRGTDPAAAFLSRLAEKPNLLEATFLVDGMGYLTALTRCDFPSHLDYVERNLIENWFQTLAMRIGRFHQMWIERRASVFS